MLKGDFRRFITRLRNENRLSPSTIQHYERWLKRYSTFLEASGIGPWDATEDDVADFIGFLQSSRKSSKPYKPETIAQCISELRAFYRWGQATGLIEKDPMTFIQRPHIPKRLPRVLTQEQVKRFLGVLSQDTTPTGLRNYAAVELLYATGIRISELIALDLPDLCLNTNSVYIYSAKTKRERVMPLHDVAVQTLGQYMILGRPYLMKKETSALFINQMGERVTRKGMGEVILAAAKRAGLGHVTPHQFRHSFATHMHQNGVNTRDLQELLGHANIKNTEVYTHVSPDHLFSVYKQFHPMAIQNRKPQRKRRGRGRS